MHRPILVASLVSLSLPAQTVWNVPYGAAVDPVIAQANPGDILQLSATHPPFDLTKGLIVRGASGGTTIGTSTPWIPGRVVVNVPAGQRASIRGIRLLQGSDSYTTYEGSLELQSGQCDVSDVGVQGVVQVSGGNHVLQRISDPVDTRFQMSGGVCSLSDSNLRGGMRPGYPFPTGHVAMLLFGGTLIASHVTATGSDGVVANTASEAVFVNGGTAWFTDCVFTGGNMSSPWIPQAASALVGNNQVFLARTTLIEGTGSVATPPSSGYALAPEMVGMSCQGAPTLGASFTAVATAGNSQQPLGIFGGFDATPGTHPLFVEPLWGAPANLVPIVVAVPAPGATVSCPVTVPNAPALAGFAVWLQAAQISGATIRASTVVGGTIR